MHSESLPELIDRFVSYKKANGYQYQTGAYYLKRYARFVMETAPGTAAPDKVSVEGFLEKFQDAPGSLYNAAAGHILSHPEGCIFPRQCSRIFLRIMRSLHSSGNVTGQRLCLI